MPAPRWIARFNRRVTNRVLGPLARRLPWFGVVTHRGRTTGRRYRTPVNVFPRRGRYVIALTYGARAEWVRNVMVGGGCELETGRRTVRLTRPRILRDEGRRAVPLPVRLPLQLLGVVEFLELEADGTSLA
jgi:deazaflavin-dependent oxidoreductase (nitroreductase family)